MKSQWQNQRKPLILLIVFNRHTVLAPINLSYLNPTINSPNSRPYTIIIAPIFITVIAYKIWQLFSNYRNTHTRLKQWETDGKSVGFFGWNELLYSVSPVRVCKINEILIIRYFYWTNFLNVFVLFNLVLKNYDRKSRSVTILNQILNNKNSKLFNVIPTYKNSKLTTWRLWHCFLP